MNNTTVISYSAPSFAKAPSACMHIVRLMDAVRLASIFLFALALLLPPMRAVRIQV